MVGRALPVRTPRIALPPSHPIRVPGWPLKLANFVLSQMGWFAAVGSAARGHAWLGSLVIGVALACHFAWSSPRARELVLLAAVTLLGLLAESLQLRLGLIGYTGSAPAALWPPLWLLLLWTLFGSTLNLSLRWLRGRFVLASVLAAVCGPLAFAGGVRMGAAHYVEPRAAVAVQAVCWALLLPLMLALAQRLDGPRGLGGGQGEGVAHG